MNRIVKGFRAGEALPESVPVKITDGKVYKVTAVTDAVIGVTDSSAQAGKIADVIVGGLGFVQVDGSAAAGDAVIAKANGKAQKFALSAFADATEDTPVTVIGRLLDGDTTGGAYLPAVITCAQVIVPAQKSSEG